MPKGEKLFKHGFTKTRLHNTWKHMRTRCNNPNAKDYKYYGGRGIKICKKWDDFIKFRKWALKNGYTDDLEIDRIDNDKNYKPKNCRWVTRSVNTANSRLLNKRNTSGYRGVKQHAKKWQADIQYNKKFIYLGQFNCPTAAAIARDKYIIKHQLPHQRNFK